MKPEHAAYIAGIMDGEGCFRMDRFRTSRSPIGFQYRPVIEVSMCNCEPIQFISELTGRHIQTTKARSGKKVYLIVWRNSAAADLIQQILPFLLGKKPQAETLLYFHENIAPGRGRTYSQDDFAICEYFFNRMKELKHIYTDLRC